jgi:hypothetical protein
MNLSERRDSLDDIQSVAEKFFTSAAIRVVIPEASNCPIAEMPLTPCNRFSQS